MNKCDYLNFSKIILNFYGFHSNGILNSKLNFMF